MIIFHYRNKINFQVSSKNKIFLEEIPENSISFVTNSQ